MSKYIISLLFLFCSLSFFAQTQAKDTVAVSKDTITHQVFKIRFGVDLGSFILAKVQYSTNYSFFVDANVYKNYYGILEFGFEDKLTDTSLLIFNTKGNFVKLGVDYNLYDNWLDMDNDITVGLRYGQAFYATHLHSYTINQPGAVFPPQPLDVDVVFNDLSASWLELVSKVQVQTFKGLYLGYSINFKYLLHHTKPNDFETAYIPGFGKRNSYSNLGFGMQYFISYRIKF